LNQHEKKRAEDLGLKIGWYKRGRFNAITDVPGVRVGHATLISGEGTLEPGSGPVRTGVTAILPHKGDVFMDRVVGSAFVLNGAGEVTGITQLTEWGQIETPILLTNTMSVGACSDAMVRYMVEKHPGIGQMHDVIIPIVGECDDSWLNDTAGGHVREKHVLHALQDAHSGRVDEGSVGAGTGMITCDFKAGIGTSSRRLSKEDGDYTIGALVLSNFGKLRDLRIDGIPIGRMLESRYRDIEMRAANYGSIIVVLATNAPLSRHQMTRVCRRAALGIGRVGSYVAHNSGEIVIGFSNSNIIPRTSKFKSMTYKMSILLEEAIDPLYQATIDATEEAILNSLFSAEKMSGHSGHTAPALPLDEVAEIIKQYQAIETRYLGVRRAGDSRASS
jgi:D-aminopeptidase